VVLAVHIEMYVTHRAANRAPVEYSSILMESIRSPTGCEMWPEEVKDYQKREPPNLFLPVNAPTTPLAGHC